MDKKTMQNISEASAAKWKRLHELEAENVRLGNEVKRLRDSLTIIALQRLSKEQDDTGDFIEGYDQCVSVARAALGGQS